MGYPPEKPTVPAHPHGWCFKPQRSGLKQVLSAETYCVVELGSYLGNSTRAICEAAPNAQVYCVDRWDLKKILSTQREQYQPYELEIMHAHPLYETFLVNTWDLQERVVDEESGAAAGVTPMRMDTVAALDYLATGGAYPDVIYIDGDHSTKGVKRDLEAALRLFPDAIILGNDYRNETVQLAVDAVAGAHTPEPLPVYTDGYSMIWILRQQLLEGNFNTTKCIEDAQNETINRYYRSLKTMISSGAPTSEIQNALLNHMKTFRGYLNHCLKRNKGRTLLMHAAAEGHAKCVQMLMKSFKADPHVKGHNNDYTALHHAAYNGQGGCAKALLLGGAKCSTLNKYNETPAQSAHSKKHYGLEKAILGWLQQHPEGEGAGGAGSGKVVNENAVRGHGLAKKKTKKKKKKKKEEEEEEEDGAGVGAGEVGGKGEDEVSKLLKQREEKRQKRKRKRKAETEAMVKAGSEEEEEEEKAANAEGPAGEQDEEEEERLREKKRKKKKKRKKRREKKRRRQDEKKRRKKNKKKAAAAAGNEEEDDDAAESSEIESAGIDSDDLEGLDSSEDEQSDGGAAVKSANRNSYAEDEPPAKKKSRAE